MAFDVEAARKAGYSDAEIADHLAQTRGFDTATARKAGYSDSELITHLSKTEAPKQTQDASAADYADVPGGGALPQVQPAPGSSAAARQVLLDKAAGSAGRIGQAVQEGWQNAPRVVTPEYEASIPPSSGLGVNRPLISLGNAALGAGAAVLRGGQQLAQEATPDIHLPALPLGVSIPLGGNRQISGELTPGSLGREVAALPEAFPTGEGRGTVGIRPAAPQSYADARAGAERGNLQVSASAPPPVTLNELTGAINRTDAPTNRLAPKPAVLPQGETGTPKPAEAPAATAEHPGAAGAQITPAAELGMTPAEEAAYRSTAEGNKLLEPHEPGVRDDKQYLPGERINEAEASQDVETARQLKSLRQQTPELDKEMAADEAHNNNIRTIAIHNAIPGQVQITAAKIAREKAMTEAEPQVFAKATDADVRPIARHIQDELSDPNNRQNTQLQQHVRPLIDRLVNQDGTPKITDPKELWSFRKDVQHLTSGDAQAADQNLRRISGTLGKVLDVIDNQLEAAAPGYKAKLRDDYRTRSREIDAMVALNGELLNLFDSQNKPNYNAVQRLMKRIVDARQGNDPYEPFTHVNQETLDKLWAIRDSMKRSVAADRLAAPKGSPTSQNLGDALRTGAKAAMTAAAPAIGAYVGNLIYPGAGMVGGTIAGTSLNYLLSQRGLTQRLAQGRGMLNRNQLGPQAAPPP